MNIPNVDLLLLGAGALIVYRRRVHIAFVLVCVSWIDEKVSIWVLKYQVTVGVIGTIVAVFYEEMSQRFFNWF